jgi:hypothetical protein
MGAPGRCRLAQYQAQHEHQRHRPAAVRNTAIEQTDPPRNRKRDRGFTREQMHRPALRLGVTS